MSCLVEAVEQRDYVGRQAVGFSHADEAGTQRVAVIQLYGRRSSPRGGVNEECERLLFPWLAGEACQGRDYLQHWSVLREHPPDLLKRRRCVQAVDFDGGRTLLLLLVVIHTGCHAKRWAEAPRWCDQVQRLGVRLQGKWPPCQLCSCNRLLRCLAPPKGLQDPAGTSADGGGGVGGYSSAQQSCDHRRPYCSVRLKSDLYIYKRMHQHSSPVGGS